MKKVAVIILSTVCLLSLTGCNIPLIGSLNKANQVNPPEAQNTTQNETQSDTSVSSSPQTIPLSINIPGETYQQNLKLTGKTIPGNNIIINEKQFNTDNNGNFIAEINLIPGKNIIDVKVVSNDGKSIYNKGYTVEYYVKPKLEIVQFNQTSDNTLSITGNTDPNCLVNVKGYITQSGDKGSFELTVPIDDRESSFTILTTNAAGNSSSVQKRLPASVN